MGGDEYKEILEVKLSETAKLNRMEWMSAFQEAICMSTHVALD